MSMSVLVATLLALFVGLSHRLTVSAERATITQGDPLLLRIDLTMGSLRPSYLPRGFYIVSAGVGVEVRGPTDTKYHAVHSYGAGYADISVSRPAPMLKSGTRVSLFSWHVSSERVSSVSGQQLEQRFAYAEPGKYLVRARVSLRDANGEDYGIPSRPVTIHINSADINVLKVKEVTRPVLYRYLEWDTGLPTAAARELSNALPKLKGTATASTIERLLALYNLREAKVGKGLDIAVTELDRLRDTLPPVGREHLDLAAADILANRGELDAAEARLKRVPGGPRSDDIRSVIEAARRK